MNIFVRIVYGLCLLLTVWFALDMWLSFGFQEGAPQQAVVAAWGAARVIVIYVVARCAEKIFRTDD